MCDGTAGHHESYGVSAQVAVALFQLNGSRLWPFPPAKCLEPV